MSTEKFEKSNFDVSDTDVITRGDDNIKTVENVKVNTHDIDQIQKIEQTGKKWTKERAWSVISTAYEEWKKQHKTHHQIKFNNTFFRKSHIPEVKTFGNISTDTIEKIIGTMGTFGDLIYFVAQQHGAENIVNDFEISARKWDEEKIYETITIIFDKWKNDKEGRKFNSHYILSHDRGLWQYIYDFRNGDFEQYFTPEMESSWHVATVWTDNGIREELQKIYSQWLEKDKSNEEKFNQAYIKKINHLCHRAIKKRGNDFEKYLNDEMRKHWYGPKLSDEQVTEELRELYELWKKKREGKFNPHYILTHSPRIHSFLFRSTDRKKLSEYFTNEMLETWGVQEHTNWTEDEIKNAIKNVFEIWKKEDADKGINFGKKYLMNKSAGLFEHLRKFEKQIHAYLPPEAQKVWRNKERIPSARGYIIQYAVEILLRLIDNKHLLVEKTYEGKRPDLMYLNGERPIVFDVKTQSTTKSIEKDIKNYSKIISQKNPDGGYLVFLCLNGPTIANETIITGENFGIRVKYYKLLKFANRLENDNHRLLKFLTGGEIDLEQDVINKIHEINTTLQNVQKAVQEDIFTNHNLTLEEAQEKYTEVKTKMRQLARGGKMDQILQTNFKELLDV